ncbi:hypothetical protein P7F88_05275 [Vibrio hannami]|uniref:hypothetical protein n=1 Tax=Vibrio hannami TaxID=2717094 RepID=UPI00240FA204|nr:hypothetical protein [Vibrio hannami]MDG3085544.1 hypothetical protein [Vibrio hannami]
MQLSEKKVEQILLMWGASTAQLNAVLEYDKGNHIEQNQRNICSIHECLKLLFEDEKSIRRFMSNPSNQSYFKGRSPLEIILRGSNEDIEITYESIRNMLCF